MRGYQSNTHQLKERAYAMMVHNTESFPAFHGYVEGAHLSVFLDPVKDASRYEWAVESFTGSLESCLIGHYLGKPFELPEGLRMNRVTFNVVYWIVKAMGRTYCYNSTVSPFNMQGMYLTQGDAYLKRGDMEYALAAYENALAAPNSENWPYADEVLYRIEHLEESHRKFLADSGKLIVDEEPVAMNAQASKYCVSCHATRKADGIGSTDQRAE